MAIIKDPNGSPLNCEVREVNPKKIELGCTEAMARVWKPARNVAVEEAGGVLRCADPSSAATVLHAQESGFDSIFVDVINVEKK